MAMIKYMHVVTGTWHDPCNRLTSLEQMTSASVEQLKISNIDLNTGAVRIDIAAVPGQSSSFVNGIPVTFAFAVQGFRSISIGTASKLLQDCKMEPTSVSVAAGTVVTFRTASRNATLDALRTCLVGKGVLDEAIAVSGKSHQDSSYAFRVSAISDNFSRVHSSDVMLSLGI